MWDNYNVRGDRNMINENFWKELWKILLEIEDNTYWSSNFHLTKKDFIEIKKRLIKTIDK